MKQQSGPLFVLSTILTGLLAAAGFLYWVGMAEAEPFDPRGREAGGSRSFTTELVERHGLDPEQEQGLEAFVREERRRFMDLVRDLRSSVAEVDGAQTVSAAWEAHAAWRSAELQGLFPPELAEVLARELIRGEERIGESGGGERGASGWRGGRGGSRGREGNRAREDNSPGPRR